ncbi:Pml39p NDAI_0H02040 [Naumovozyma dairenensis CBS 421]|uniref:C3HC-type domain-containing protein n=1 Tax=Naumovozyma dairenensis (strain ATCC 10597 / BCRC 20456 / CBS 421 / NBRC 0211 / NRRL Y-12639) TaxID=1071378 RepID=G0WF17_NAUDC|nr:hypothetical protein NDAI_0H02040 [Naumovozyma dairenensis CBS 421]CCD26378.1 hypothetical protein NDAI_0H02040 [Naumovozyma dairenensis CBS 421]
MFEEYDKKLGTLKTYMFGKKVVKIVPKKKRRERDFFDILHEQTLKLEEEREREKIIARFKQSLSTTKSTITTNCNQKNRNRFLDDENIRIKYEPHLTAFQQAISSSLSSQSSSHSLSSPLLTSLYEDKSKKHYLYSMEDLLKRARSIAIPLKLIEFKNVYIPFNPIVLASKGWELSSVENKTTLVFKCESCHKCFNLEDHSLGEVYNIYSYESQKIPHLSAKLRHMMNEKHSMDCRWKNKQFPLLEEYYIDYSQYKVPGIGFEIERIRNELINNKERLESAFPPLTNELIEKFNNSSNNKFTIVSLGAIYNYFKIDMNSSLLLFLSLGYDTTAIPNIMECSKCFIKVDMEKLINATDVHRHLKWCRYSRYKDLLRSLTKVSENIPLLKGDITIEDKMRYFKDKIGWQIDSD